VHEGRLRQETREVFLQRSREVVPQGLGPAIGLGERDLVLAEPYHDLGSVEIAGYGDRPEAHDPGARGGMAIGLPVSVIGLRLVMIEPDVPRVPLRGVTSIAVLGVLAVATAAAWIRRGARRRWTWRGRSGGSRGKPLTPPGKAPP
jgi:hypothetical protein